MIDGHLPLVVPFQKNSSQVKEGLTCPTLLFGGRMAERFV